VKQDGELAVEEILESIKKVVAGEPRGEAAAPGERPGGVAAPLPTHDELDDHSDEDGPRPVLELTDALIAPADHDELLAEEPVDVARAEPDVGFAGQDRVGREDPGGFGAPAAPLAAAPAEAPPSAADAGTPLVAESARAAMRESLAALSMLAAPETQAPAIGSASLDRLTRDLLRPMLAEWLDKNLPPLVERLVATEIANILAKRG
jgi:cell pole-organizing protein PopZ